MHLAHMKHHIHSSTIYHCYVMKKMIKMQPYKGSLKYTLSVYLPVRLCGIASHALFVYPLPILELTFSTSASKQSIRFCFFLFAQIQD